MGSLRKRSAIKPEKTHNKCIKKIIKQNLFHSINDKEDDLKFSDTAKLARKIMFVKSIGTMTLKKAPTTNYLRSSQTRFPS